MFNVLSIFSKNCILVGDLDWYCLACSALVTGDVMEHIRNRTHNAKLKLTVYYEKYKDDFIKKVDGVYFCEMCNTTVSTAAKVAIHVTEDTHIQGKRAQLTRLGTCVLFQKDKLIEERAWNGFVEDTCVVCNTDFHDCLAHTEEHRHALNVVRSTVTIDDDNNIYRKVDGGYQCLTCNKVTSDTEISKHLNSAQHKADLLPVGYSESNTEQDQVMEDETYGDETKENPVNLSVNKEIATKTELMTRIRFKRQFRTWSIPESRRRSSSSKNNLCKKFYYNFYYFILDTVYRQMKS